MNWQLNSLNTALSAVLVSATLALSACGGGGGASSSTPVDPNGSMPTNTPTTGSPAEPETVALTGVVADGLIQGASVCYDLNDNSKCDAGEPVSIGTGADGKYTLSVPASEAGKHAVIANVPVGAVDSDTGTVTVAYGLKAPPQTDVAQSIFVSPITTIVQEVMRASGATNPAAAIAQVKTELGMLNSPLDNFVAQRTSSDPAVVADANRNGKFAQVITKIKQDVGVIANSANVPEDQREALLSVVVINNLPRLADVVANQGTQTTADLSSQVIASQGITTQTVAGQAQVASVIVNSTPEPTATVANAGPVPFVTLRDFRYLDANNWSYRLFTGDDVTQSDGKRYFNEVRKTIANGNNLPYNRNTAFYVPSSQSWYSCPSDGYRIGRYTPTNAAGESTSDFCRTYTDASKRTNESIAGQTVKSVVERIRASGLPGYDTWGPAPGALANQNATFPAGSVLRYQVVTGLTSPDGHNLNDKVRVFKNTNESVFEKWPFAAGLDEMIQYFPGVLAGGAGGGANTDGLGQIPDASVTDTTLQKVKNFRVSFQATSPTAGNAVFYQCRRNLAPPAGNGFTNCVGTNGQVMLNTTYSIETLADARVMRFATYPAEVEAFRKFRRTYVERSGAVFYGFKDVLQTNTTLRLNQQAWDALRAQTPGVTAHVDPSAPVALDSASWLRDMRRGFSNNTNTFSIRTINSIGTTSGTYSEVRATITSENTATNVITFARNRLYLVAGTWKNADAPDNQCASNGVNIGVWNSNPRSSTFCGISSDTTTSFDSDLSGKSISAVLSDMRLYGSFDFGRDYSTYGPLVDATLNANDPWYPTFIAAVFPAGSKLRYQASTLTSTSPSIGTGNDSLVLNGTVSYATLSALTAAYTGGFAGALLNGATTLGITSYQSNTTVAAGTTGQKRIRVAFEPNTSNAKFYLCDQSSSTTFTTGCVATLDTTYSVTTIAGKNVLQFAAHPEWVEKNRGTYTLLAEHNGSVYYGGKDIVGYKNYGQRLNQAAYEAIFNIFGITLPAQTPTAP